MSTLLNWKVAAIIADSEDPGGSAPVVYVSGEEVSVSCRQLSHASCFLNSPLGPPTHQKKTRPYAFLPVQKMTYQFYMVLKRFFSKIIRRENLIFHSELRMRKS
jgi:hypothetical protein